MPTLSRRSAAVVAFRYDDFPVHDGDIDMRGDRSLPLRATEAALKRSAVSAEDLTTYGAIEGELALREALGALFHVAATNIVITAGGSEALHLALTCVAGHDDRILLPRPAFPGFMQLAQLNGLRVIHYRVPGPLPKRADSSPMVVCTPHNPTGIVVRTSDVDSSAGWTIWDVAHSSLSDQEIGEIQAALSPTGIVTFSLSKLLRLPGVRVGCLMATDRELIDAVVAVKTHLSMSVSRISQRVATNVLVDPDTRTELVERRVSLAALRRRIVAAVAESSLLTVMPGTEGTHLLVRTRDGSDGWQLLRSVGLTGLPGRVFDSPADVVRLCISQHADVIDAAAERLALL